MWRHYLLAFVVASGAVFRIAIGEELPPLTGNIGAYARLQTAVVSLKAGQQVEVLATGSKDLAIDVFVYEEVTRELIAKSDDDAVEPFSWDVPKTGRYYLILRNAGSGTGSYTIKVTPQGNRALEILRPNAAVVKVFYATDRVRVANGGEEMQFGGEPQEHLQFGVCKVSIPRGHKMGELEGPSILRLEFREDVAKHIVLMAAKQEDERLFFSDISNRVEQSAHKEILVFVHGFNTDFESAARRTAQIAYDLGFDGAAVLYSWPSQGRIGLVDYNKDGRNAELSVPHLVDFLTKLASQTGAERIHLIAHSMGNRVVTKALASLAPDRGARRRVQQVALLAPDIDAAEFRRLAAVFKSVAGHVTLYASSRDEALKVSQRLQGYPRAGEAGPNIVIIPGLDTIDASAVDTSMIGLSHSYFADNQSILSDLFYLIRGNPPAERTRLRRQETSAGMYWAFVPAVR
ncbi:MAG: alpha/beta fold hydrolase [Acidobacteriaceae bacterium]|nr:alpha/beta fold hydrolase [Acidobacteriaceae bacterium]MBV9779490.1 alpha/beta fold hydrolase [Acidobacteriaceae bacterium]